MQTAHVMKSLAPVLVVDAIEPCLSFWEHLGFARELEVPEGERLGFVKLTAGEVTVMYQTRTGLATDIPALADAPPGAFLYIQVDDLDAVAASVDGCEVVVPRRTTFYGADEIAVREPGGNVVCFARMPETVE